MRMLWRARLARGLLLLVVWVCATVQLGSVAWAGTRATAALPAADAVVGSHYAFIANYGSNNVSVIDLAVNEVVATIAVGSSPTGVATHPDGSRAYVSNSGSDTVSVIDSFTHTVLATVPVGARPIGVAVHPDGSRAYVAHFNAAYLAVIDLDSHARLPDIASSFSGTGLAINPSGSRAYLGINNGSAVQVFDLQAGVAITTTTLSNRSYGVAVNADGSRAYVVQNQAGRVAMLDTSNNSYSNFFTTGGQPIGVAVNPANGRVYTTVGSSLVSFDPASFGLSSVAVGNGAHGVSTDASGSRVYVVNSGSGSVSVLDAGSLATIATIPVGADPRSLGQFISTVSVPGPPRNVLGAPGDGQASLQFEPPLSGGGLPISSYTATCMPGAHVASGAAAPLLVQGLLNGEEYACVVRASNARGEGVESAAVAVVPGEGSHIISSAAAAFTVLQATSFSVLTSGEPVLAISAEGSLPAGLSLSAQGVLAGTAASGTVGDYPLLLRASNGSTPDATQNFTLSVVRASQTIDFPALPDRSLADTPLQVSATGTASGIPVLFTALTPGVCSSGGENGASISLIAGGTCTLAADQAADVDHLAAPRVQRSFMVRLPQQIAFGVPPAMVFGQQRVLDAAGGGSGNPVQYSSTTPAVCTTTEQQGRMLTAVDIGTCTVQASQSGNAVYEAAPTVVISFTIGKAPQHLVFNTTPLAIGQTVQRQTSIGGSGMPVVLVGSTPGVCTLSGLDIHAVGLGWCRFTANQTGGPRHEAASEVQVAMSVGSLMQSARSLHTATRLADGRVLVTGGITTGGPIFASAEIYDPSSSSWSATGSMAIGRVDHSAVLLADGRVLVVGGMTDNFVTLAQAEIYDPVSASWSSAGALSAPRRGNGITVLDNGEVLVSGGQSTTGVLGSAELFDPATRVWSAVGSLAQARQRHSAVLLPSGKVLVSGGAAATGQSQASSELYDPQTRSWTAAAVGRARHGHSAMVLGDGSVLLAGGSAFGLGALPMADRYDPATNTWSSAGSLVWPRTNHAAALLADGRVLLTGGMGPASVAEDNELHDPLSGNWSMASPILLNRIDHTATLLQDGSVLIAGGFIPGSTVPRTNSAELYFPELSVPVAELAVAVVDSPYGGQIEIRGGVPPLQFSLLDGVLPAGVALSAAGVLEGTPQVSGQFTFTVGVSDGAGRSASQAFQLRSAYRLLASSSGNGTLSPQGSLLFIAGETPQFSVLPAPVHAAQMSGSCGGSLTGSVYTTAAISTHCTVVAEFVSTATVPAAPTAVTATPGTGQASIAFVAPADGGKPILGYTASTVGGGASASCSAPCNSLLVTGLDNGSSYSFIVRARNELGEGPPSAPSNSVVPLPGQQIQFGAVPVLEVGFTAGITTTGGASGNPVVLSSITPGVCSVAGSVASGLAAGSCRIAANQAGNAQYLPAPQVVQTIPVSIPTRTISASASGNGTISPSGTLQVAFGSVQSFTVSPASGYSAIMAGSCGGNLQAQVFTTSAIVADCSVSATFATVPAAPAIGVATADDGSATVSFSAPASNGGSALLGYRALSSPGGHSASCTLPCSSIRISGLTNGTSYAFTVSARNALGHGPESASSGTVVPLAAQQISFQSPPMLLEGGAVTIVANGGGSGNPVLVSSLTPQICSSGGEHGRLVSGLQPGLCTLAANQAGNVSHAAAPQVQLNVEVVAVFTVTPSAGANGSITPAQPQQLPRGASTQFNVRADPGFTTRVAGSCGGELDGEIYTTTAVQQHCSVVASFVRGPDAPLVRNVEALQRAARVEFDAPGFDGGSPVLGYTAQCRRDDDEGGSADAGASASSILVQELDDNIVYRCAVHARNAQGSGPASAWLGVIPGSGGNSADLYLIKDNHSGFVNGAEPVEYLIEVGNAGPAGVVGARVEDPIGSATDFAAASWTCTPLAGAVCPQPPAGSGGLDVRVDLPVGAAVRFLFSALPWPDVETPVSNTAAVLPPAGMVDPQPGNNVDSDGPDLRGVFRDGFE